jgi:thioredoxin-like negative regulator of GroEL
MLWPPLATAKSVLTRINKISNKNTVELYCSFTSPPVYRYNIRGKRVDFILDNTTLEPNFTFFKADDKIVKILSLKKNNKTILSFFFRYPPQRFDVTPNQKENKLTVNILLGNPYSSALPNFSSKLAGLTILERTTKDYSNPLIASPYAADWKSFFKLYESKIHLSLPVQFTILPFPAMALLLPERETNRELLSDKIYELAEQNLWNDILPLLLEQITTETDTDIKKKLALTYGDVLSRDNNFVDAYKQFYLLADEYAEEEIGIFAKYLLILLRARFEDPFIADFELKNLQQSMTPANPLTPYFLITQIETALATEQYSRMHTLLARDDIAFSSDTAMIRELRQADYWYGTGDSIKAYIGYQLLEKHEILLDKIFSLNGYCDTLYQQKQFSDASRCYATLTNHINDKEKLGLINHRKYMSELHYKTAAEMVDSFARIENTYPETEAGFRSALKKTDLQYLTLKDWSTNAILYYKTFAEKAITRASREEASFKEALVYRLNNENIKSVNLIMPFLRNFRNGELYKSGQALLIELFPLVIHEYVENKMYMEALVLAKQNRNLFLNNWVDIDLLAELAAAYNSIGIYNEASKLYLYLISLSSEDQKEQYYLPLITAAYDHGDYNIVEDYADQYSFRYPNGTYKTDILMLRIESMLAEERVTDAVALLPNPIPETENFSLLAATLYFHENNYDKIIDILDRSLPISDEKRARRNFLLAESFYQLGNFEKAGTIFAKIPKESSHHDQALYRMGELLKKEGKKSAALKLYKKLVETGQNSLWIKMAQKELELNAVL